MTDQNITPLFEFTIEPRWFDADPLGHINHVQYFRYLEEARVKWMSSADYLRALSNDVAYVMLMVNVGLDFRREHHHPEALSALAYVSHVGNSSFRLHQQLFAKDSGELVAEGPASLVWVRLEDHKPERISDAMRELLGRHLRPE
ncbi:putative thioesterase [Spongiibacter sp. IMCC21906]|jgi:acyl-CoA thioester hydrolase|uniref:acyl-CoA thioesterase n=1 Tax=Spongiibacter sp. IMCC21906 TaxID=1620392 RepID=UPI00062DF091|nr:thioesterase family protein [Spongiibacter sp. IMCC21906]AKH68525.1 putative thioesterase [Spongiibacter sp. IMCC21906]